MNWMSCNGLQPESSGMGGDLAIRAEFWASSPFWNGDQIAWLLLGYDPLKAKAKPPELSGEEDALVQEVYDVLQTRYDGGAASRQLTPSDAIDLFKSLGRNFPEELVIAVETRATTSSQSEKMEQAVPTAQGKEITALRRRLDTVTKMMIAMAIRGYNYDPKTRDRGAAKDIETDLISLNLSVSEQTIVSKLREAYEDYLNEDDLNSIS